MSLPPMYTFTMLKLSDEYRSMPVSVTSKLDSYGMTIYIHMSFFLIVSILFVCMSKCQLPFLSIVSVYESM